MLRRLQSVKCGVKCKNGAGNKHTSETIIEEDNSEWAKGEEVRIGEKVAPDDNKQNKQVKEIDKFI